MRTVGVVTVGRSDYGLYRPLLKRIAADPNLDLRLIVAGAHLVSDFGHTYDEIRKDGYVPDEFVEMSLASDSPASIAKSMGLGAIGFAEAYRRIQPDILIVLGDRFEMHSATVSAVPFAFPIAHIHGGELTLGSIDDAYRHSITKLSHLHFVSTKEYANRVVQMGEAPWRVTVVGALSVDAIANTRLLEWDDFIERLALPLTRPFILVTYHPETAGSGDRANVAGLLQAVEKLNLPVLFTRPNADSGSLSIWEEIKRFTQRRQSCFAVDSLGSELYFSAMSFAAAMAGNSSSGIVEAMSFALPVVNIGSRQLGRPRSTNVMDVDHSFEQITSALHRALSADFRSRLRAEENIFGDGLAAKRIVNVLNSIELAPSLLVKQFHELPI